MGYCAFAFIAIYRINYSYKDNFSSVSKLNFFCEMRETFKNKNFNTLIIINILAIFSSLPLFVTYLALGIHLDTNHISQLIVITVIGKMLGLLVLGKLVDRIGFKQVLYGILLTFFCIWPLWLFVQPQTHYQGWLETTLIALACVGFLTSFLYSGFELCFSVGTHNTITDNTTVVALAFCNMISGLSRNIIVALGACRTYQDYAKIHKLYFN